jgi:hypothetical protein
MSAEFFALAFLSALNPKLLALDLLLIENRRPRAMFVCLLLGGMTVALTVGLLLLAVSALLATGRVHGRRRAPVPAGGRATAGGAGEEEERLGAAGC